MPLTLILVSLLAAASGPGDQHLLQGARAFRDGRYVEALVEFRVAEKLGAGPDARAYAAASLVKLDRPEEALELFGPRPDQGPVLEFYRALACYQARLFTCADQALKETIVRFGPRVRAEARSLRKQIRKALPVEVKADNVDWYLDKGAHSLETGRPALGLLYAEEARALGSRRKDCHRCAEAEALRARARVALAVAEGKQP